MHNGDATTKTTTLTYKQLVRTQSDTSTGMKISEKATDVQRKTSKNLQASMLEKYCTKFSLEANIKKLGVAPDFYAVL